MLTEIDWKPFVITLELFAAFVLVCFLAAVSDLWAKSKRRPRPAGSPVVWRNGEQVFLN